MSKRSKLLFYWEPYSLSVEQYDDNRKIIKSASTLLTEEKTPTMAFEELNSYLDGGVIEETSLLIRQTTVMLQQYTIPHLKGKEKNNYLEAKVRKDWEGSDPFYWSHVNLKSEANAKDSTQTFAMSRHFIDAFIKYSKQINALPLKAFTTQALAVNRSSLISQSTDKSILLFDDENSILLIMVDDNKPVLLREMSISAIMDRADEFDRLSKEIQRTWLYAKQQYKFFPTKLILSGSELYSHRQTLSSLIDEVIVEEDIVQDWKESLFESPIIHPANLIPQSIQKIKQTLHFLHIWTGLAIFFLSASIIWNLFNLGELSSLNDKIKSEHILGEISEFEEGIKRKQIRKDSLRSLRNQIQLIEKYSNRPVPAFLLMYMSENIPDDIVLTQLKVSRDTFPNKWNVSLYGNSPRNPIQAAELLKGFSSQTTSDLQRLNLSLDWKKPWLENLRRGQTLDKDVINKPFRLEGVLFE